MLVGFSIEVLLVFIVVGIGGLLLLCCDGGYFFCWWLIGVCEVFELGDVFYVGFEVVCVLVVLIVCSVWLLWFDWFFVDLLIVLLLCEVMWYRGFVLVWFSVFVFKIIFDDSWWDFEI